MGESNTVVSVYTLYRPIHCIGTYNSIVLTHQYTHFNTLKKKAYVR